ncbi:MAG: hypothetical protein IT381_12025 [Deltaproteobacteria bacterium]|nr:hypothetical protein [Deltaproteobacteria bacterium]
MLRKQQSPPQNITIRLRSRVLAAAKRLAHRRGKSMSQMLTELVEQAVNAEDGHQRKLQRALDRLEQGYSLKTGGKIGWTRDQVHDRG